MQKVRENKGKEGKDNEVMRKKWDGKEKEYNWGEMKEIEKKGLSILEARHIKR